MEYTIRLSTDKTYILILILGDITRTSMLNTILEAHARGRELNVHRYLVDITHARNTESLQENYQFASSDMINVEGVDESALVATLIDPDDHSHDFVLTVAKNAGPAFNLFTVREKALEFLKKNVESTRNTK